MTVKETINILRKLRPTAKLCWNCKFAAPSWKIWSGIVFGFCWRWHKIPIIISRRGKLLVNEKELKFCSDFRRIKNNG